jgi:predicted nucleic acid-binding protein
VFLDSSMLFSACYSTSGFAHDLLAIGRPPEVELGVSEVVLMETRRNLTRKDPRAAERFERQLAHGPFFQAHPSAELILEAARVIEPKDAPIVAGAIAAGADFLATYDRVHLLAQADLIRDQFGFGVATPKGVLDVIANRSS